MEFDRKRKGLRPASLPDVTDEIVEQTSDHVVSGPTLDYLFSTSMFLTSCTPVASDDDLYPTSTPFCDSHQFGPPRAPRISSSVRFTNARSQ